MIVGAAPFVGRERELEELEALLVGARASRGVVAVLTGAAGIGKTRLASEISARAAPAFDVIWATCGPGGAVPPFWPWTQVLADGLRRDAAVAARAAAEWPAAAGLATPRSVSAAPPRSDPGQARAELFEDVVATLAALAARRPLLIVVDDLQDADSSSWLLLAHLVPRLRSTPIAIVATWRTGDVRAIDPAAAHLLRQIQPIAVAPLGVAHVTSLLRASTGAVVGDDVAAAVYRRTSGNPLLAHQVLAELQAHGRLQNAAAVADVIPDSTRVLVADRIAGLTAESRDALAVASAIGSTFATDVVAAVLGQPVGSVLDALAGALDAGVLDSLGPTTGTFAHDVVRDAAFHTLSVSVRADLHRRVGEALERLRDGGRSVEPVELARHFLAGGAATAEQGAAYARAAADRAMAMLAYEDAAGLYARAVEASDQLGPDPAPRAKLRLALGDALDASGNRAGARRAYLDAATDARAAARGDLLAAAALGLSGTIGFEVPLLDRQQVDVLREALAALGPDETARRAAVMARLSVTVSFLEDLPARVRLTEDALALARQSGDGRALVQALAARCDALAGPDHCTARARLASEIVEVATTLREPQLELLGRRLLIVALLEVGDLAGVDREVRAFAATADAQRRPLYSWYVPLWRGMRAALEGRAGDAQAAAAEAERLGAQAGSENAVALVATLRWCLAAELGLTEEVRALTDLAPLEAFPGVWPIVARALTSAQVGRLDEARARLDAAAPRLPDAERDSEWLPMMAQVADAISRVGPHPVAEYLYESLLPYRHLYVVEGIGAAVRGSVERDLGVAAAAMGRPAAAAKHFDAAVAANERLGANLLVARTLRDAGVALDDPDRLRAARERYDRLAADRRVAEIDERLGRATRRPVSAPPTAMAENRLMLEGELWHVAYAGREVRLRDSKGLRDLARLLEDPGRPLPAVALLAPTGGLTGRPVAVDDGLHEPGDLGDVIDQRARDAYRRRLTELDEEIDDADQAGDPERSARATAEKDALVAQLAAAYGLGGRPRRAGDPAERARQTVTARIRDALGRIEAVHPELGQHLRRSVRTGRICVYEPDSPVHWSR